ncbi:MAG: CAP domain-containing protein [Rhodomicrobium sp.]|nr:CAP domain-containing protein [Rhodomicrobium sp.]
MADAFIIRSHAVWAALISSLPWPSRSSPRACLSREGCVNSLLAVSMLGALVFAHAIAFSLANPAQAEEASLNKLRMLALQLVNASRKEHKLSPLALESKLTEAAQFHASDMMRRSYYAHSSPEGKTVADRYQKAGGSRWVLTAENIAKCDGCPPALSEAQIRKLHEGWMNSPGHKANILRAGLTGFGYGLAVTSGGTLYAVQTFAGPGTPDGGSAGRHRGRAEPGGPIEGRARRSQYRAQKSRKTAAGDERFARCGGKGALAIRPRRRFQSGR